MKRKWRVINTGTNIGSVNMAIDEAIMAGVKEEVAPPTVRFYGWAPPTVTIGYFQDLPKEVNTGQCAALGIDVVRRLTGGRAVLHHQEVTYSIICPEKNFLAAGTIIQSYLRISQGLLAGIKELGLAAELVAPKMKKEAPLSAACFEAPSWYELAIDGKKLVGSAQTRKRGIMLQHGSIPLEMHEKLLAQVLCFSSTKAREFFEQMFANKATALNEQLKQSVTYNQVVSALISGFSKALEIELIPSGLTSYEKCLVKELNIKYKSNRWNYSKGKNSS